MIQRVPPDVSEQCWGTVGDSIDSMLTSTDMVSERPCRYAVGHPSLSCGSEHEKNRNACTLMDQQLKLANLAKTETMKADMKYQGVHTLYQS